MRTYRLGKKKKGEKALTLLQRIDLRFNGIGDEGATALGPHLAGLTSVLDLCLLESALVPRLPKRWCPI